MIPVLAKFFKENGVMDRPEYRASNQVPYSLREVERVFKNYAVMLYEVSQYKLPEAPKMETPVASKRPVKRSPKRAKQEEDSLDEGFNSP